MPDSSQLPDPRNATLSLGPGGLAIESPDDDEPSVADLDVPDLEVAPAAPASFPSHGWDGADEEPCHSPSACCGCGGCSDAATRFLAELDAQAAWLRLRAAAYAAQADRLEALARQVREVGEQ
jgi:hypothetical protein